MTVLWIVWSVAAALIVALCAWAGWAATGSALGLLIDTRGRYSLSRLQVALWTIVVVSLLSGITGARATVQGIDPLSFSIPGTVLATLGLSVGSTVLAVGVKTYKNQKRAAFVAASLPGDRRFSQMFMIEEGSAADESVDVTKLQNFLITLFLIGAYTIITIHAFAGAGPGTPIHTPADIHTLPTFNSTFLGLLAISHAGYLAGKLPSRGSTIPADVPAMNLAGYQEMVQMERDVNRRTGLPAKPSIRRGIQRRQQQQAQRMQGAAVVLGSGSPTQPPNSDGSAGRPDAAVKT